MAALGTAGPGTEIILGASEEHSSSYFPLKLLCITVVLCVFLFKSHTQGRCEKPFAWGCRVKFTRICLNTMGAGGKIWVSKTCNVFRDVTRTLRLEGGCKAELT